MSNKEPDLHVSPDSKVSSCSSLWKRLVSFGFRLLYHELAWSYDLVAWLVSCGQWQNWGRAALPYLVGECVLGVLVRKPRAGPRGRPPVVVLP